MEEIVGRLNQVPLFASLSQWNKAKLAEIVRRRRIPRGAVVVRQGQLGTTYFMVCSGEIVALAVDERGNQTPPRYLHAGDVWGETSLLVGEPRDATMVVQEDAELCYIRKADFDKLVDAFPSIWSELTVRPDVRIKLMAPRFPWMNKEEKVEWFGHKHWYVFARSVAIVVAIWLAVMLALLLAEVLASWHLFWVGLGLTFLLAPWVVWRYIDWQNDWHVITNQRIAHVEKVLLQYESRSEAPLDKVQNTSSRQGLLGNALGFAHIAVSTAGARSGRVEFMWAVQPELARKVLEEQVRRFKLQRRVQEYQEIAQVLETRLEAKPQQDQAIVIPGATQAAPSPQQQARPARPPRDVMSLLSRDQGCSRILADTGLYSFILRPHLPRLSVIVENEAIIWRKHWIVLVRSILAPLFFLSLALAVTVLLLVQPWPGISRVAVAFLALPLLGALFFWLMWQYEDWRNDLYVVTPTDIIDIERTPFLARETRRQANLENIQDIHFVVPGFWAQLIKRGDVVIETAGEGQFTFNSVYDPSVVQREIFNRLEVLRQRKQEAERHQREQEIAEWFAIYHEKQQGKKS